MFKKNQIIRLSINQQLDNLHSFGKYQVVIANKDYFAIIDEENELQKFRQDYNFFYDTSEQLVMVDTECDVMYNLNNVAKVLGINVQGEEV